MLFLETADFNVNATDKEGEFEICGLIENSSDEPLASIEVLNCEDEVFAVDPADEFKLDHNLLIRFTFSTKKTGFRDAEITIPGVSDFIFKPWSYPYAGFERLKKINDKLMGKILLFGHGASMLFSIPRNKIDQAELQFNIQGIKKFRFKVKDILQK